MVRSKSTSVVSGRKQRIEGIVKNLSAKVKTKEGIVTNGEEQTDSFISASLSFQERMEPQTFSTTTERNDPIDSVYHLPPGLAFSGVVPSQLLVKGKQFGPFTGRIMAETEQPSFDHSFICQIPGLDGGQYSLHLHTREQGSHTWLKCIRRRATEGVCNIVAFNTPEGIVLQTVADVEPGLELCVAYDHSHDISVTEVSPVDNEPEQIQSKDPSADKSIDKPVESYLDVGAPDEMEVITIPNEASPMLYNENIASEEQSDGLGTDQTDVELQKDMTHTVMTAEVADDEDSTKQDDNNKADIYKRSKRAAPGTGNEQMWWTKAKKKKYIFEEKEKAGKNATQFIYSEGLFNESQLLQFSPDALEARLSSEHFNQASQHSLLLELLNICQSTHSFVKAIKTQLEPKTKSKQLKPQQTKLERSKPEKIKPKQTKPEITKPEVTKPEVTNPEVTKQEITKPEGTKQENTKPEGTSREETNPDEIIPEENKSERTIPEEIKPEGIKPEGIKPEGTKPEGTKQEQIKTEQTLLQRYQQIARRSPSLSLEPTHNISEELAHFCAAARANASSVGHFATILTKHLFSPEQRENRNCLGRKGKLALDPAKLSIIRYVVFKYYDVEIMDQQALWKHCILRIDEMLRRKTYRAKCERFKNKNKLIN